MEFMDALEEFSGSNDHSIVIKGKRTKRRQRPLSPVGRAAVVTSSSSSGGGGDDQGGGKDGEVLGYIYSLIPSCNTSTSDISISATSTDQEDEDMANCLILLAQGESCRKQVDQDRESKMEKFTSRRFNEMATTTTTGGKVGFFVYQCKTCNRTFPSFQALGGHRASHKKPKINIEDNKATIVTPSNDHHHHQEEEEEEEEKESAGEEQAAGQLIGRQSPPLSIQSTNKPCSTAASNKASKSHECSICGAEFASGQALGGHMRRHRNSMTASTSKVATILETSPSTDHHDQKPRNIFPLDLNLPAPSEDDVHRDLKFQFSANQQPHLVFSAPALVDCHY